MDRPNLEWHCGKCDVDINFRYVSSNVAAAGNPEHHFYTCTNNCGTTYELQKLMTLENISRIYENNVTIK